jgi:hypothetical protein
VHLLKQVSKPITERGKRKKYALGVGQIFQTTPIEETKDEKVGESSD